MTNADLQKKYNSIFPVHLLYNSNGKTLLAGTQYRPAEGKSIFGYVPLFDDFMNVPEKNTVAIIRIKTIKSKQ